MDFLSKIQRITLYLFFFSINFEVWDPFDTGGSFSIAKLTAIFYFITILPQIPQFLRIDRLKAVLFPVWIFFGFLTFMSLINVNELYTTFFYLPIFLNIFLLLLLVNHARKDYLVIERAMLWFAFGSVIMVMLFLAGIGVQYDEVGRLSVFSDNPNGLGLKVTISSFILLLNVFQNRLNIGRVRYLFLLLIPLMLYFIGETGSRVAIISFILAFMTGTILYKAKTKILKISILLGSGIVLILIALLLMQSKVMIDRLEDTSKNRDLGSRDKIWKAVFPIVEENPIIGIGKTGYNFRSNMLFGRDYSPHNVFLEILCYTGAIGLFIYLFFVFQVFKRGYQTYKKNGWLLPMLLFIPTLGLLSSGQMLDVKIGWIIYSYIVSSSAIKFEPNLIYKENIL